MAVVHKSVFLGYSTEQMFDLVAKVEDYPKFLPWCGGVKIIEQTEDKLVASLQINFHGVKQSFTTSNHNSRPTQIKMHLVDGPFKVLEGTWTFKPLRADACKVELDMHYEFSSIILEQIIGPVFGMIANTMVDSFSKRAEAVYG
ncbi:type II toxin-antitoxin system RatA family toxin [Massilia alkalitolerans]|jgi:ribosome-associated toxin RatA of RatAB toxin-antitoxin module|uniref:type II toxin-antitoxin system RatA family toxin n=1 Tax=Massilia alkalitolerans TaxID=286638 RepID=UPI0004070BEA|nr:type II toxin-antitoxin system RatA family toxin [Massilia alkalitolerans]